MSHPPGYLRSLNNPSAKGHPDHYSLRRFIGTSTDDGGVHFNVTIATHAFYLAVAGGTQPRLGHHRARRRARQHRAHGEDLLPRVHAVDGAQLAVLRRAARHAAGRDRPLRRRQQRTRTGRARLDRRGGELMRLRRSSIVHRPSSVVRLRRSVCSAPILPHRAGALPHRGQCGAADVVHDRHPGADLRSVLRAGIVHLRARGAEEGDLRPGRRGPGVARVARGGGGIDVRRQDRQRHGDGARAASPAVQQAADHRQARLPMPRDAKSASTSCSAGTSRTAGGLDFTLFAGPSIFTTDQLFVKSLTLSLDKEVFPFDELAFPPVVERDTARERDGL